MAHIETELQGILDAAHSIETSAKALPNNGRLVAAVAVFLKAVQAHNALVLQAVKQKKVAQADLEKLLGPLGNEMGALGNLKEEAQKGRDPYITHITALAEAVPALGWVTVEPAPGPYTKEMTGAAQFWTNKVLKDWKGKEGGEPHLALVAALLSLLEQVQGHVKAWHTTGLAWNSAAAGAAAAAPKAAAATGGSAALLDELQRLVQERLAPLEAAGAVLAAPLPQAVQLFAQAFHAHVQAIQAAAKMPKKATEAEQGALLGPLSAALGALSAFKEQQRPPALPAALAPHLNALAEAAPALGWLTVEPTPGPYLKEMLGAAQFWTNKILKDWKGKDGAEPHLAFVHALTELLLALHAYVIAYHTTGLVYNVKTSAPAAAPAASASASSGALAAWDALNQEHFQPFLAHSAKLGGPVQELALLFAKAVEEERKLLEHALKTKPKPSAEAFQALLAPLAQAMGAVTAYKEASRARDVADHMAALAEGVQTLAWLTMDLPAPFAKEAAGAAQFWTNKVLKAYRGKDERHVDWVNALNGFLSGLEPYVKQWHTTGLAWGSGQAAAPKPAAQQAPVQGAQADWEALVQEHVQALAQAGAQFGGALSEACALFLKAAEAEGKLLQAAKAQKKPNEAGQQALLGPVAALMGEIGQVKEKHPKDAHLWHLTALAEASAAFGWVAVEPAPAPYAKEIIGAAAFWTNKILKEHKGKDGGEKHVAFVTALSGFLNALPQYIVNHHTTGLTYGK